MIIIITIALVVVSFYYYWKWMARLEKKWQKDWDRLSPSQKRQRTQLAYFIGAVAIIFAGINQCAKNTSRKSVRAPRYNYECKYIYSWYDKLDAVLFCPDGAKSGPLKTPIGEGFGEFGISGIKGKGNIEGRVGGQRVMCLGKLQTQEFLGYDNKQGVCLLLD